MHLTTRSACGRQTGFNEEQALSTKPDANRHAGKVVIISVIGLAVLLLLITVVSALTADERNQDTSEQAPAQFAVVPAGKANCHASVQAAPV